MFPFFSPSPPHFSPFSFILFDSLLSPSTSHVPSTFLSLQFKKILLFLKMNLSVNEPIDTVFVNDYAHYVIASILFEMSFISIIREREEGRKDTRRNHRVL